MHARSAAGISFGIRAVQIGSALCSLALLGAGVGSLRPVSLGSEHSQLDPPSAVDPAPGSSAQRYAVIAQRNLFRASEVRPDFAPEAATVQESQLDLSLIGTLSSIRGDGSVAVVAQSRAKQVAIVGVGDLVADGRARVARIEQRRVVLDHAGKLEWIELDPSASRRAAQRPDPPRPEASTPAPTSLDLLTDSLGKMGWTEH